MNKLNNTNIDSKENEYIKTTKKIDSENALNYFLESEFDDFKEDIIQKSKKEIFNRAYEITAKMEIKDSIKHMNLHRAEKEMLILQDNILDDIYQNWLKDDTPLGSSMENSIERSIDILTKHIGKKYNLSRQKENER